MVAAIALMPGRSAATSQDVEEQPVPVEQDDSLAS
jgi:hypothetical protein